MTVHLARALRNKPPDGFHIKGDSFALGDFKIEPTAKEHVAEAFKRYYGTVRWQRLRALFPNGHTRYTRAAMATAYSPEVAREVAKAARARARAKAGRKVLSAPDQAAADIQLLKWDAERRRDAERAAVVRSVLASTSFPCAQALPGLAAAERKLAAANAELDAAQTALDAAEATADGMESEEGSRFYASAYTAYKAVSAAYDSSYREYRQTFDEFDRLEAENEEQAGTLRAYLTTAFVGTWEAPDPKGVRQLHFLLTGRDVP
jgi:hypothetical protein